MFEIKIGLSLIRFQLSMARSVGGFKLEAACVVKLFSGAETAVESGAVAVTVA